MLRFACCAALMGLAVAIPRLLLSDEPDDEPAVTAADEKPTPEAPSDESPESESPTPAPTPTPGDDEPAIPDAPAVDPDAKDAPPAEAPAEEAGEKKPEDEPAPAEPPAEEAPKPVKKTIKKSPKRLAKSSPDKPAPPTAKKPASDPVAADDAPSAPQAPAAPIQRYDLRYQFKPGETVRTRVIHQATVQTTIQGTSRTAETKSTSIKSWIVDSVDEDGTARFMHMVESIDMRQKTQGQREIHYNSATGEEPPPGYEDAAKAVGVPLTLVTMTDRGKILKREEQRAQPESISTQMTMPLPKSPVAIGESWSIPIDIDVSLKDGGKKKIKTRQKFTLEEVVDDLATISVDSQILTPISDPAIEAQLIQRLSTGTVRFDIAAGRVLSQQLDLDRHVIGFSGPASSMHYVTRFTEKWLKPGAETARAKKKSATTTK